MKPLKIIVATALLVGAFFAVRRLNYEPVRCNILAMNVKSNTRQLERGADAVQMSYGSRRNLELLQPCLDANPWNITLQMLAGTNYGLAGKHELALQRWEAALQYDRRPELYRELGISLVKLGRVEEAMPHLVAACVLHPEWVDRLPDDVRGRVNQKIIEARGEIPKWRTRRGPFQSKSR